MRYRSARALCLGHRHVGLRCGVAPLVRRAVPEIGRLLDVGAGGGQLGAALPIPRCPGPPSNRPRPCARVSAALASAPHVIAAGWETADLPERGHDTVLAATMPAFFDQPEAFLARCRAWARRSVVWVVPAHAGPRGLCFAGCLPSEWHGEDETPGIDIVMAGSGAVVATAMTSPSRTGPSPASSRTSAELAAYLADRLGWAARDLRRAELERHLVAQARPDGGRRAPRHCQEISRSFLGDPMNNPCIRKGAATVALLSGLAWVSPAVAQQPPQPPQPSRAPTQPLPPPAAPKQPAFMPEVVVTATGYPEEVSKIAGTVQVIQPGPHRALQRQVGHRAAGRELRRLHERVDRGPDLDQHPRRRHRRPGPRLQEPGADPDQRPSRRHGQRLQAVDRRRRAHRDRPRARPPWSTAARTWAA